MVKRNMMYWRRLLRAVLLTTTEMQTVERSLSGKKKMLITERTKLSDEALAGLRRNTVENVEVRTTATHYFLNLS